MIEGNDEGTDLLGIKNTDIMRERKRKRVREKERMRELGELRRAGETERELDG